ncbi:DUF6129 family protein [Azovibrio restrictus]|uniref:DUF6129 family protein n=1 Tax=Azovibrio restrictus TaxID=146938 RepID=UPI0026F10A08|nr:DUF6129 family protein [Azovibrio restrictus]
MSITPELLDAVAAAAPSCDLNGLRQRFPGVLFTLCSEDDVPARLKPVRETPTHLLHLYTHASGHCLEFTPDPDLATGIVVAARADD